MIYSFQFNFKRFPMNKKSLFNYLFSLLLFGSNGLVASYIHLGSLEIVLLRTLIGSLLLIALFFITGGSISFHKHKKAFLSLVISGIAMGASWMFLYEAYAQIGVSIASLLYYCGPVIVMALSPMLFGERLTGNKILGFLAVAAGILLINGNAFHGQGNAFGIVCGLLSAIMYAVMVICNKKSAVIAGLENATLQLTIAFLTTAVFMGLKQGYSMPVTSADILPILTLGLLNTGIGCYLYFSSIGKLQVQTVAICGYLEPLSAVLFSVIFLKEVMLPFQIIGAALIIAGAMAGESVKKNKSGPLHH